MTNLGNLLFGPASSIAADNHVLTLATSGYSPPPVVQSARDATTPGSGASRTSRGGPGNGAIGPDDERQLAREHRARASLDYALRHARLRSWAPPS